MLSPAPQTDVFTAPDGYQLAYRRWAPPTPQGDVVLLHGIISHSGWYLKTGAHLAAAGFSVHSLDRRGSGMNFQSRGDVDAYSTWIDDVVRYVEALGRARPVVLMGISWGGLLATAVARRRADLLAGLCLVCPGFFARKGVSAIQHHAVRIAARVGMGGCRFPVPLRDPALFTDSPWWRHYIRDDPFTLTKVTLRLAVASGCLYSDTIRHPEAVTVPTLLMLAGRDPLIKNAEVRDFVRRFSAMKRRVIEYPDACHTLEFEPDPSDYLRDLEAWCRARCE